MYCSCTTILVQYMYVTFCRISYYDIHIRDGTVYLPVWMIWNRFLILQQKKCKLHCGDLLRHLQVDAHVQNSNHSLCTGDTHSFENDTNSPDFFWQRNCLALKRLHLKISQNFSYTIILIKLLLRTHVTKTCSVTKTTNKAEA